VCPHRHSCRSPPEPRSSSSALAPLAPCSRWLAVVNRLRAPGRCARAQGGSGPSRARTRYTHMHALVPRTFIPGSGGGGGGGRQQEIRPALPACGYLSRLALLRGLPVQLRPEHPAAKQRPYEEAAGRAGMTMLRAVAAGVWDAGLRENGPGPATRPSPRGGRRAETTRLLLGGKRAPRRRTAAVHSRCRLRGRGERGRGAGRLAVPLAVGEGLPQHQEATGLDPAQPNSCGSEEPEGLGHEKQRRC
jgi:hypothetical protein